MYLDLVQGNVKISKTTHRGDGAGKEVEKVTNGVGIYFAQFKRSAPQMVTPWHTV